MIYRAARWLALAMAVVGAASAAAATFVVGTTNLLEGPGACADTVCLGVSPAITAWTASASASWLHLQSGSGTGGTNVSFTCDANPGANRSGTLTIAGQTVTVTQAGSAYVPAQLLTLVSSGLAYPGAMCADTNGNIYITDDNNYEIEKWVAATGLLSNVVNTLNAPGLGTPSGCAVDPTGNLFIVEDGAEAVQELPAKSSTLTTIVSSGLVNPSSVAADPTGNVYIADNGNNAVKVWSPSTKAVSTAFSAGVVHPTAVVADAAGNVYVADASSSPLKKWTPANNSVSVLNSSGSQISFGLAVDGGGNLYLAEALNNVIQKWTAGSNIISTLSLPGISNPWGVAVDRAGNLYIGDTGNKALKVLPRAFVVSTGRMEGAAAGMDALPPVLPTSVNLTGPYAPISDSAWLTITSSNSGVVGFSFTTASSNRVGHINLLGISVPISQQPIALGAMNLVEGPAAGTDGVVLEVDPNSAVGAWTATNNAPWLHVNSGSQGGLGGANVIFNFDANLGSTRTGTLTIAGQTLTVVQAGAAYVLAQTNNILLAENSTLGGLAVDTAGNVYIADANAGAIKRWNATNGTLATVVSSGLSYPSGVSVDRSGNIYIADINGIKEWNVTYGTLATVVSSGLYQPCGVAVDATGNVYIADTVNDAIKRWANGTMTTLDSSTSDPYLLRPGGVALDGTGNLYFAEYYGAVMRWSASNGAIGCVYTGEDRPWGLAVDGAGNLYDADSWGNVIQKWTAASGTTSTLISSGLNSPDGVAVDGVGNLFFTDNRGFWELPRAFVVPTGVFEGELAGSDALPPVLPASANLTGVFAPSSDSAWLTVTGVTNGVVSFSHHHRTRWEYHRPGGERFDHTVAGPHRTGGNEPGGRTRLGD
jgi:sugar lactone lactonase YvrE